MSGQASAKVEPYNPALDASVSSPSDPPVDGRFSKQRYLGEESCFALIVCWPLAIVLAPLLMLRGLDTRTVWRACDGTIWESNAPGAKRITSRIDVSNFGRGTKYQGTRRPSQRPSQVRPSERPLDSEQDSAIPVGADERLNRVINGQDISRPPQSEHEENAVLPFVAPMSSPLPIRPT
jgi:hypothetical protein